jgi:hypothetical protein
MFPAPKRRKKTKFAPKSWQNPTTRLPYPLVRFEAGRTAAFSR